MMRLQSWIAVIACVGLCAGCSHQKPTSTEGFAAVTATSGGAPPTIPGDVPTPTGNLKPTAPARSGPEVSTSDEGGTINLQVKNIPSSKVPPIADDPAWQPSKFSPVELAAK